MAIMGRKKKANAQSWGAIDKQRKKDDKSNDTEKKEISEEEHKRRVKKLREIGLIKD